MVFSVMALPLPPTSGRGQGTISFASTLYLCPILDLLLSEIPPDLEPEIRLGLQEALVNAATHGNQLDTQKTIASVSGPAKTCTGGQSATRDLNPVDNVVVNASITTCRRIAQKVDGAFTSSGKFLTGSNGIPTNENYT